MSQTAYPLIDGDIVTYHSPMPTMRLRWVVADTKDCDNLPTASKSFYGSVSYYKLQQYWQAMDTIRGEWRDVDIEDELSGGV